MARSWKEEYDKLLQKQINLQNENFRLRQDNEKLRKDYIDLQRRNMELQRAFYLDLDLKKDRALDEPMVGKETGERIINHDDD